jgi:hypothetical protein
MRQRSKKAIRPFGWNIVYKGRGVFDIMPFLFLLKNFRPALCRSSQAFVGQAAGIRIGW